MARDGNFVQFGGHISLDFGHISTLFGPILATFET